jgi:hypothetical protein
MGTLFVDNIKQQSSQGSGTITIGASGETVALGSGVTPSGNFGNLVHIKTITLSSSSSAITFLNSDSDVTFDTTYNTYKFIGNILMATDNTNIYVRVSDDGTNIDASSDNNYKYNTFSTADDAFTTPVNDGNSSVWQITKNPVGNATGEFVNFEMTIFNDTNLGTPRHFTNLMGVRTDNGSEPTIASGRYVKSGTNTIKGITFFPSSSRSWAANSVIRMYGVKG